MKRIVFTLIGSLISITCISQNNYLDPSFGNNGIVHTNLGDLDQGHALAIQNDGKIVVVGQKALSLYADNAVIRYNTDGSLDTTFGQGGVSITDISGESDSLWDLLIQPDGKIIVVGESHNEAQDIEVLRFESNGDLDSTFGINGIVLTNANGGDSIDNADFAYSAALQSDGKIVVGGLSSDPMINHNFTILRYNSDGSIDQSFGNNGFTITEMGIGMDMIRSLKIQSDGKIVAVGYGSYSIGEAEITLIRYTSDGNLDPTFGINGKVNTSFGTEYCASYSLDIQMDGKIIVGGKNFNGSDSDIALIRYNTNGSLDNTFGVNGKVSTTINGSFEEIYAIQIDNEGKIICAGYQYHGIASTANILLARYTSSGSLDASFGTNGILISNVSPSFDVLNDFVIQNDGKYVITGWSDLGVNSCDVLLARYFPSNQLNVSNSQYFPDYQLYPNPANNVIYSEKISEFDNYVIYNILGESVQKGSIEDNSIMIHSLNSGTYFLFLENNNQILKIPFNKH